jgi:hypothetical protein
MGKPKAQRRGDQGVRGSAPRPGRAFIGFQYLTPPLSVALELALSAAEAVARLVLRAGRRPPGGGKIRRPSALPRAVVTAA